MIIIDALKLAPTEHVVYFLLTAYVETVEYRGDAARAVPEHAKRMPVRDIDDLMQRLAVLRSTDGRASAPHEVKMIDDVASAYQAAAERLGALPVTRPSRRLHESRSTACRTRSSIARRMPPAPA